MTNIQQCGCETGSRQCLVPPFYIGLLNHGHEYDANASRRDRDQLLSLLPASYRKDSGELAAVGRHITACVAKELHLERLTRIHDWLWVAGLPLPPRALHNQLLLGRGIFVTERMDMHLVWTTGQIFLKPIPRFLLEPSFWAEYLCCRGGCGFRDVDVVVCGATGKCECQGLRRRALGFLASYAALICHESDFRIAQDKHLLPPEVAWPAWRIFVEQLDTEHVSARVDPRFHYGELRLSRLNKIYTFTQTPLRGYVRHWNQYGAFFHDNFAWLASASLYIVIVLTAMQVGLATDSLGRNDAFQAASYGFTIFSILGPLIAVSLIMMRHDPRWATFNGAYINEKVEFHLERVVAGEPTDDCLIDLFTHMSLTRDPEARQDMVPDEIWQSLEPDPEISDLEAQRDKLKTGVIGFEAPNTKTKSIREYYRQYYFYHRPTWEIEQQLVGDDQVDEAYSAPAIDLHVPERERPANLLCQQADDLDFDGFLRLRVEVAELMVALIGKRETAKRKRIVKKVQGDIPSPVPDQSPEPGRFPLVMRKAQCPRCIGDEAMSVEERTFAYCRPAVMNDHFDREHLVTMEQMSRDGFIGCMHSKCREEDIKLHSLDHFRTHVYNT
ncbi:FluG domain-containing protein [Purpureocillium lilacinum]|uniref:FluG domain-containing protein n=1 Tax=Purpureocillium lilacinum TaxID=33203 RepID=A0A179HGM1_PURLI|nr:FluG domain-containing protein [Purpureocillium lilacinum]OAQ89062.1 FluG domain-containing protein [Purpureocillium lilacinum]